MAELIERSGATKSVLSTRSGVSRSLIDDYLKGRRQPSLAQLDRLGQAVGYRMRVTWAERIDAFAAPPGGDPGWLRPDNPAMKARPLTIDERAQVLELVVPVAMQQRRRPRGDLTFPPFRELVGS